MYTGVGMVALVAALSMFSCASPVNGQSEVYAEWLTKYGGECSADDATDIVQCVVVKFVGVGVNHIIKNCTLNCSSIYLLWQCIDEAEISAPCIETLPLVVDNVFNIMEKILLQIGQDVPTEFPDLACMNETRVLAECPDVTPLIQPVWGEWLEESCENSVRTYVRKCVRLDDASIERRGCQGSDTKEESCTGPMMPTSNAMDTLLYAKALAAILIFAFFLPAWLLLF